MHYVYNISIIYIYNIYTYFTVGREGDQDTLGMSGTLDLVTGMFPSLICSKNSIKAFFKTLTWQILQPEAKQKNYFGPCIPLWQVKIVSKD